MTSTKLNAFTDVNKNHSEIIVTLQMNGPSGSYIFDAESMLDDQLQSISNPVSIVVHDGDNTFKGSVQMNAKFEVL